MSVRGGFVLLLALSTLTFLIGCGSSGPGITQGVAPPSGAFGDSNLDGTYVFSVSGTDANGASYSLLGMFNANGGGGITGGAIDMNDAEFAGSGVTPLIDYSVNSNSSYLIGKDGRGQATLVISNNPLATICASNGGNIVLDFVLQNSFHGLVTEFDCMATGSGTIDVQTAGVTPAGSYAFSFAGATSSNSDFVTVGNFTLSGSSVSAGLEDFNLGGAPLTNSSSGYPVSGTVVAGPSSTALSSLTTGATVGTDGTIQYDVYPIDSTHLKFIEVDSYGTLLGDAFTESTSFPTGTLVFTLSGLLAQTTPFVAGGLMVTSGGSIGSGSTEDYNEGVTGSTPGSPIPFTGTYSGANGRFVVALSSFIGGVDYVAYPSSGGMFFMETDSATLNLETGVATAQVAGAAFAASQGYGLNLSGANLTNEVEVDDIAEFTASASGASCSAAGSTFSSDTLIGVTDENYVGGSSLGQALCGEYGAIDTFGRIGISYAANILNGGITATSYTVDGTAFPFIETDSGQVSTGVFILQNASATSPSVAKAHGLFVPRPMIRPHALRKGQK